MVPKREQGYLKVLEIFLQRAMNTTVCDKYAIAILITDRNALTDLYHETVDLKLSLEYSNFKI